MKEKEVRQIAPYSVGFDCGNNLIKVVVSGHGVNAKLRFPSYYLDVTHCPNDHSINRKIKYIKAGERTGAKAKQLEQNQTTWLAGNDAYIANPERRIPVFGDIDKQPGKVQLGLPLFLSIINQIEFPESKRYEFRVAASVHDAEAFGEDIKESLQGEHIIEIGGKQITVVIHVIKVFDEGYQFKPVGSTYTTVVDIGYGTVIKSRFNPQGEMLKRDVPIQVGVQHLYQNIFNNPEFRKIKGSIHDNRVMELIRRSVEKASEEKSLRIKYGVAEDAPDITEIYKTSLSQWFKDYLLGAVTSCVQNQNEGDRIVIIGGGSQLPFLKERFDKMNFFVSKNPVFSNVFKLLEYVTSAEETTENVDDLAKESKVKESKPTTEKKQRKPREKAEKTTKTEVEGSIVTSEAVNEGSTVVEVTA